MIFDFTLNLSDSLAAISLPGVSFTGDFFAGASLMAQQGSQLESWYSPAVRWPASMVVLFSFLLIAIVVLLYKRERGKSGSAIRAALIALRLALLAMLIVALFGWQKNAMIVEKPELVIVIDTSASMGAVDQYDDEQINTLIRRWVEQTTSTSESSRLGIAKSLLGNENDRWLENLGERYELKLFRIDDGLQPIAQVTADGDQTQKSSDDQNRVEETEPADNLTAELASLKADGTASRLGKGLIDLIKLQRGRPTAAILLFTDGINTAGPRLADAANIARKRMLPLHILGIGSAKPPRDVRLGEMQIEETVFVDDVVTVDLNVFASGYEGNSVSVTLREKGQSKLLAETVVQIDGDSDVIPARMMFRPTQPGELNLEVRASQQEKEIDFDNNVVNRSIRVRDETIRVLLVADHPNREFHYLKQLFSRALNREQTTETKQAVELKTFLQRGDLKYASTDSTALRVFPVRQEELYEFDVIVLCDARIGNASGLGALGSRELDRIYEFVAKRGKGLVFIAGPNNRLENAASTPAERLLPIELANAISPDPSANLKQAFQMQLSEAGASWPPFQLGDSDTETGRVWDSLPGFYWSMEAASVRPGARVMATHPVRRSGAGQRLPLVATQYVGAGKVIFHATAETYRWRFRQGDRWFGRYWMQLIRYLSRTKLNQSDSQIRLVTDRNAYNHGENVVVTATFVDDRLAPDEDSGVSVVLEKSDGTKQIIKLTRTTSQRGYFETRIENLSEGTYQLALIEPVIDEKSITATFDVTAPQTENAELRMNADELKKLAEVTGGKYYSLSETEQVLESLPQGRQVALATLPPEPLWQKWYVVVPFALLFTLLLTTEWIIRKTQWML